MAIYPIIVFSLLLSRLAEYYINSSDSWREMKTEIFSNLRPDLRPITMYTVVGYFRQCQPAIISWKSMATESISVVAVWIQTDTTVQNMDMPTKNSSFHKSNNIFHSMWNYLSRNSPILSCVIGEPWRGSHGTERNTHLNITIHRHKQYYQTKLRFRY